jgi:nitric oxide reductase NorD protein
MPTARPLPTWPPCPAWPPAISGWWLPTCHSGQTRPACPAEAAWERAIRQALLQPQQALDTPPPARAPYPLPLWLHPAPPTLEHTAPSTAQDPQQSGPRSKPQQRQRRRYRAQRVVQDERKNGMLMIFRAESLFTWDEYVKVNRHTDEDDDDNAAAAPRT